MKQSTLSSGHCLRICAAALEVDVEQAVDALGQAVLDGRDAGAVAVAVHHRPLGELARGDHLVEAGVADEAVVPALYLAGAGAARREGNGEAQAEFFGELAGQGGLAGTGRGRDDQEQAPGRYAGGCG